MSSSTIERQTLAPARTEQHRGPAAAAEGRIVHAAHHFTVYYVICDWLAVFCSCALLWIVIPYFSPGFVAPIHAHDVTSYAIAIAFYATAVVGFFQRYDLYGFATLSSPYQDAATVVRSVINASLTMLAVLYVVGQSTTSRRLLFGTALLSTAMMLVVRHVRAASVGKGSAKGRRVRNVLIVGTNSVAQRLADEMSINRQLGYKVTGFLDARRNGDERVIGTYTELPFILRTHFIDDVFVALPADESLIRTLALEGAESRVNVSVVPCFYDGIGSQLHMGRVANFPVLALHRERTPVVQLVLKRVIDVVLASIGIVAIAPLFAFVALLIKLDSKGPVLYRSARVGKKGHVFQCWKFRTMVDGAEAMLESLLHLNERERVLFKLTNDPRLTRLGRFLRRYSIDEIPQLLNVLTGEMSLVGPRPPTVREYEQYQVEHLRRLAVTPGITGLWQVSARTDPSFETYLRYDLRYIEDWSLWLDVKIMAKTFSAVLSGTGA